MNNRDFFDNLNYSLGDEDSRVEYSILPSSSEGVLAIAGSGGRCVPLLAKAPQKLICADISSSQMELTKLRFLALDELDHATYLKLLGYNDCTPEERLDIFTGLNTNSLDKGFASGLQKKIRQGEGLIYLGGFEQMLMTLNKVIRIALGDSVDRFLKIEDLQQQRDFYRSQFPRMRWKLIMAVLGNSTLFNTILYKGRFPAKNINKSYYTIYRDIFDYLFSNILVRQSFFVNLVLWGKLKAPDAFPIECSPEVYKAAKQALAKTDIQFITKDFYEVAASQKSLGFISLSDLPSFERNQPEDFLQRLKPSLAENGFVVSRAHVRLVNPSPVGFNEVTENFSGLFAQETTGLWNIRVFQKQ